MKTHPDVSNTHETQKKIIHPFLLSLHLFSLYCAKDTTAWLKDVRANKQSKQIKELDMASQEAAPFNPMMGPKIFPGSHLFESWSGFTHILTALLFTTHLSVTFTHILTLSEEPSEAI